MLRLCVYLSFGAFVSGNITCSDGTVCSDDKTCCQTEQGYSCCAYPNAVCCPDLSHCCPRGFRCNMASQHCEKVTKSWMDFPFLLKIAAGEPIVTPFRPLLHANNKERRHGAAAVYTSSSEQEFRVIRCSSKFFCPQGSSCCKGLSSDSWNCCPYPLGQCCADGKHCCQYGYTCNISPLSCSRKKSNGSICNMDRRACSEWQMTRYYG